jgi:hypothetical protein
MIERGWRDFCRANHRHTASVETRWSTLSYRERARDTNLINQAWPSRRFVARTLNNRWPQKYQPVLALSPTRLIVAAGNAITSYRFGYNAKEGRSIVAQEGVYTIFPAQPGFDITGVDFLPDHGKDETLLLSNHSGGLVRIRLPPSTGELSNSDAYAYRHGHFGRRPMPPPQVKLTAQYTTPSETLRVLKVAGTTAVALSANGVASVLNTASPWIAPKTTVVGKKAWSAHIETSSSSPYMAIGTDENVVIHSFTDGSLSADPCAILGGPGRPTPVYCVGAFIPGGNPNIIASGWYDGKVRVHDLRSSQRTWLSESSTALNKKTALASVMSFSDPWRSFDPVYSLAARGRMEDENERLSGGGLPHQYHYLTAGSALHSVVCLWDVRKPSQSWSVYAPGGDRSPVYALRAEGSRVWGATQWRAFVLDFAPDAPKTSFPLVYDSVAINGPPTYVHFPT